jgi:hypothetical protein
MSRGRYRAKLRASAHPPFMVWHIAPRQGGNAEIPEGCPLTRCKATGKRAVFDGTGGNSPDDGETQGTAGGAT